MEKIHFTAVVPPDRLLHVRVPDHIRDSEVDVTVVLEPRSSADGHRIDQARWAALVRETAGAFADTPLVTPPDPAPEPVEGLM